MEFVREDSSINMQPSEFSTCWSLVLLNSETPADTELSKSRIEHKKEQASVHDISLARTDLMDILHIQDRSK